MSWNLYIVTEDLDRNSEWHEVVHGHTYNLTPMWRKALPFLSDTQDLDGMRCEDIILPLQIGVSDAGLNPDEYEKLNPDNGWGDFKGFYQILLRLFEMCRKYPSGFLAWSG